MELISNSLNNKAYDAVLRHIQVIEQRWAGEQHLSLEDERSGHTFDYDLLDIAELIRMLETLDRSTIPNAVV